MSKQFIAVYLGGVLIFLSILGALTLYIDPFFHFHYPNEQFDYSIHDERYQNDGIARNFQYDAIITGTSMTENFKTSEFDKLFGVNSVKLSFSGATFKELHDNMDRFLKYNTDVKYVVQSLDIFNFWSDKDAMNYQEFPTYLYNENVLDDVNYLFNKKIFVNEVIPVMKTYDKQGGSLTSFDDAYSWSASFKYGKEEVLSKYGRAEVVAERMDVTEENRREFKENLKSNILSIVEKYPETDFYYFFPPYSVISWDRINREIGIEKYVEGEKVIIETLLPYDNVHLFTWNDDFDLITNLNNYKDLEHYSGEINSLIFSRMRNKEGELTEDNYQSYLKEIYNYYSTYDYEIWFEN